MSLNLNAPRIPVFLKKPIILFAVLVFLGFFPFETTFSIQFRLGFLKFISSSLIGMIALLGLLLSFLFIAGKNLLLWIAKALSLILMIPLTLLILISVFISSFDWYDSAVYKNANDYIVVQDQETFGTNSIPYPRLILTADPSGIIRVVKEMHQLRHEDLENVFLDQDKLKFKGKIWNKQPKAK